MGGINGNSEYAHIVHNIYEPQDTEILIQKFPKLFSRHGKLEGYKIKCEIKKGTQQNGRRNTLQLQEAVGAEIDSLLKEGHIRMIEKINNEVFIQPVVITVKKDKTVKIALDARSLNDAISMDKNQKLNLDNLIELVAEKSIQRMKGKRNSRH